MWFSTCGELGMQTTCIKRKLHVIMWLPSCHELTHFPSLIFKSMSLGKCVHFSNVLLNVNAHRWLCWCLATEELIKWPFDPTWIHLLSLQEKRFFTDAINIDTVNVIRNIIITIPLLALLTVVLNNRKYYRKSQKRVTRWDEYFSQLAH